MDVREGGLAVLFLSTGVTWTARSLLEIVAHPDYWDPVSAIDWAAVWVYSLAWVLLAATLVGAAIRSGSGTTVRVFGGIAAVTALVTGVANGIEDGLRLNWISTVYVLGALGTVGTMVAFAVALGLSGRPRWLVAILLMVPGIVAMSFGFGVLVLIGAAVAVSAQRSRATTQDHEL
jgi:hypothetical protein